MRYNFKYCEGNKVEIFMVFEYKFIKKNGIYVMIFDFGRNLIKKEVFFKLGLKNEKWISNILRELE